MYTQKGFYIPYITKMRKVKLRKKYREKEISTANDMMKHL